MHWTKRLRDRLHLAGAERWLLAAWDRTATRRWTWAWAWTVGVVLVAGSAAAQPRPWPPPGTWTITYAFGGSNAPGCGRTYPLRSTAPDPWAVSGLDPMVSYPLPSTPPDVAAAWQAAYDQRYGLRPCRNVGPSNGQNPHGLLGRDLAQRYTGGPVTALMLADLEWSSHLAGHVKSVLGIPKSPALTDDWCCRDGRNGWSCHPLPEAEVEWCLAHPTGCETVTAGACPAACWLRTGGFFSPERLSRIDSPRCNGQEPVPVTCPDGACSIQERAGGTCPADCPPEPPLPSCGDGACAGAETCASCLADCGPCPAPDTCQEAIEDALETIAEACVP